MQKFPDLIFKIYGLYLIPFIIKVMPRVKLSFDFFCLLQEEKIITIEIRYDLGLATSFKPNIFLLLDDHRKISLNSIYALLPI